MQSDFPYIDESCERVQLQGGGHADRLVGDREAKQDEETLPDREREIIRFGDWLANDTNKLIKWTDKDTNQQHATCRAFGTRTLGGGAVVFVGHLPGQSRRC